MDPQAKLILGICLLLPLILVVNLALLSAFRSRNRQNAERMVIQARNRLDDPWKDEDDRLSELSRAVSDLKQPPARPEQSAREDHSLSKDE
jgi:hypothetical protein